MEDREANQLKLELERLKNEIHNIARAVDGGITDRNKGGIVGEVASIRANHAALLDEMQRITILLRGVDGNNGVLTQVKDNKRALSELAALTSTFTIWMRISGIALVVLTVMVFLILLLLSANVL